MPQRLEQLPFFVRALGRYRDYLQALRRDEELGEANQVSRVKHVNGDVPSIHVGTEQITFFFCVRTWYAVVGYTLSGFGLLFSFRFGRYFL